MATRSASKKKAPAYTPEVTLLPPDRRINLSDLDAMCEGFEEQIAELRRRAIRPNPVKNAPRFTSSQVAELCGIDRAKLNYLVSKRELPEGELRGRTRTFSLEETQAWVRGMPSFQAKPHGVPGSVFVVTMLKGGSTKTTSTMSLAQGLTLQGRKVLLIDLDPQASLTELCGVFVGTDVGEADTVLPYIEDPADNRLEDVVRKSYWANMDVIPAHTSLFGAEFHIPGTLMKDSSYRFFDLLREGIEPLRRQYDYILVDTPPSLSYLNINALMAADALIMPVVPESLDVLSSLTFWSLLRDFASPIERYYGVKKSYDFVSVLLTKVDNSKSGTSVVRNWVQGVYKDWVSPIEIPHSAAMSNSGVVISTVFDLNKEEVNSRTMSRIRDPLFEYCRWLDSISSEKWSQLEPQAEALAGEA